ncbi:hypothetical protein [Cohnella sp. AR92]|uniref:hypothetical protein n=1 Tax=Cohnella sp. AR92 TaxID=648716 RepID=UPI000F8DE6B3|nr:hypothetical protein [Cohnella sp. AR92]RUS47886.1 hypothetical protein ELR57_04920 [Cohnella sp. AR92]
MKGKKARIIILLAIGVIAIIVAVTYMKYRNLETFVIENGVVVSKEGVVYKYDGGLTSDYASGDLKSVQMIGKVKGDGFWGRRIYRLKGIGEAQSIAVRGLMLQEAYTNENEVISEK